MTTLISVGEAHEMGTLAPGQFFPVARFHPEMDIIQYLTEDCSYRAERVDGTLTLLWHPYEQRLVGVAIKGFHFLFQRVKEQHGVSDKMFLPLVDFIQAALENGAGDEIMEEATRRKRQEQYDTAKRFTATAGVPAEELRRVA